MEFDIRHQFGGAVTLLALVIALLTVIVDIAFAMAVLRDVNRLSAARTEPAGPSRRRSLTTVATPPRFREGMPSPRSDEVDGFCAGRCRDLLVQSAADGPAGGGPL